MGLPAVPLCALLSVLAGSDAVRIAKRRKHTDAQKVEGRSTWVTLGDSYSSGLGIYSNHSLYEDGDTQFGCYRDWDNVPGAKYAAANDMDFVHKACAFTYLSYIYSSLRELQNEYPQDTQNKWSGAIVSLTAGGNDLKTVRGETWEVLLMRCILTPSDCSADAENQVANWDLVESDLTILFTRVAQDLSGAQIRVLGYPRLMTHSGWCYRVPGLTRADADWIDSMVDSLNSIVVSATNAAKSANPNVDLQFVSIEDTVTRGACSWSNRQINGVVLGLPYGVSYATLHPQQSGYDGMLESLIASLP